MQSGDFLLRDSKYNQSINQRRICRSPLYVQERQQNQLKARSKSTFLGRFWNVLVSVISWRWWKSVPDGWTGVEEAMFTKSCSCSWQNVSLWGGGPQSVSAAGCRNCGNTVWKVYIYIYMLYMQMVLRCFLTKMLVIMTVHSCQQTQNFITCKLDEHVAIKAVILGWQNPGFFNHIIWQNLHCWRPKSGIYCGRIIWSVIIWCK